MNVTPRTRLRFVWILSCLLIVAVAACAKAESSPIGTWKKEDSQTIALITITRSGDLILENQLKATGVRVRNSFKIYQVVKQNNHLMIYSENGHHLLYDPAKDQITASGVYTRSQ